MKETGTLVLFLMAAFMCGWPTNTANAGNDEIYATFWHLPTEGKVGEQMQFAAIARGFDEDAVEFYWSFGDGGSAIGKEVAHVYSNPGIYRPTLNVSELKGHVSNVISKDVVIYNYNEFAGKIEAGGRKSYRFAVSDVTKMVVVGIVCEDPATLENVNMAVLDAKDSSINYTKVIGGKALRNGSASKEFVMSSMKGVSFGQWHARVSSLDDSTCQIKTWVYPIVRDVRPCCAFGVGYR